MPDLSIIIPVYNTPCETLRRCFDSLNALQGFCWEVLVVNDGSREETSSFCEAYCQDNSGFVYICKENGGVSSARNRGLEQAQGNYVMFVDADDCLLPEVLTPELFQSDADLILFDTDVVQKDIRSTWKAFASAGEPISRSDVLCRYVTSHVLNGPCAKLFRNAILQNHTLRFGESFVTAEDWLFGCSFALLSNNFLYIPRSAYLYYRDSNTSLSRLKRFPDTMLENLIGMYQKKLHILGTEFSSAPDLANLQAVASAAVVENLFNCAADFCLLKLQTPARKARILEICKQACQFLNASAPKKARIKAWILSRFWVGIYPVACLRAFYLKLKK